MTQGYLAHFGLVGEPFSNAPVARFYFESDQHKQALLRLGVALDQMKGLAVVTGGIGTGKTTLARRLLDALPDHEFEAALLVIIHSGVDASWLLKRIAMQLGVHEPADEKLALLSQLYQRLVQIYESGKKAVVLIDEAQMLASRELMEEFRGLLNLEVPERKLLSIVFFGLPELDRIMRLDPPLKQRVALKFRMEGLSREGMEAYILHRMQTASAEGHAAANVFTDAALDVIHDSTAGIPRLVNTVCDNTLLEAFLAGQSIVDAPLVLQVVDNLGIDPADDVGESAAPSPPAPRATPRPETRPETRPAAEDTPAQPRPAAAPAPAVPEAAAPAPASVPAASAPRPPAPSRPSPVASPRPLAPPAEAPAAARAFAAPLGTPAKVSAALAAFADEATTEPPLSVAAAAEDEDTHPAEEAVIADDALLDALGGGAVPAASPGFDASALEEAAPTAAPDAAPDVEAGLATLEPEPGDVLEDLLAPTPAPRPVLTPPVAKPRRPMTVDLDEIDSLLAQIKKPIA